MNEVSSLNQLNKRILSAKHVSNFENMFKCPICGSSIKVFEYRSLVCINRHTFDFTKYGYINLFPRPIKTKYSKELFEARKRITENGFFGLLTETVAESIKNHVKKKDVTILDMGCGEGSHLSQLCDNIGSHVTGFGIDIAKEGVLIASKYHSNQIWAVADLANTPFQDKQFDVVLNILSPSNYAEFKRIIKCDGLVVKVVPQNNYLKELREFYFDDPEKQSYSNTETIDRFCESFQLINRSRLCYSVKLEKPFLPSLIQMTPLTWGVTEERVNTVLQKETVTITVDLEILIGKTF